LSAYFDTGVLEDLEDRREFAAAKKPEEPSQTEEEKLSCVPVYSPRGSSQLADNLLLHWSRQSGSNR